ncbi:MAG: RagB/SusD family nutrient uptake outer membrane protein, partial [Longimicrobiales bacterium]|nr:RagB/SusD family nutrient uptake outer membrane protein [Longimicrobiales bacterium]
LSTNNLRIIRYADVLLMLAEAEVLGGTPANAVPLVNEVRARARQTHAILCGGSPPPTLDCGVADPVPDLATVTFADIEHERRVEFATEVHRYDDLVRWHRAGLIDIPTFVEWGYPDNTNWSETHLLKPVPQNELDLNPNLQQNPGYN